MYSQWTVVVRRDSYPMLVCANKVDLVGARCVGAAAGRDLARSLHAPYIETSAKEPPLHVDAAFHEVPARIRTRTRPS